MCHGPHHHHTHQLILWQSISCNREGDKSMVEFFKCTHLFVCSFSNRYYTQISFKFLAIFSHRSWKNRERCNKSPEIFVMYQKHFVEFCFSYFPIWRFRLHSNYGNIISPSKQFFYVTSLPNWYDVLCLPR